ncbi:flagellar biosynthetic protein FliO [Myxococcaceae bacterium GXIMD 01537]
MAVSFLPHPRHWVCLWLCLAPPLAAAEAPARPAAEVPAAPTAAPPAPAPVAPAPVVTPAAGLVQEPGSSLSSGLEEEPESLGWTLIRTLFVLGAVVASIYLTLNVGLRRLMGLPGVATGRPSLVSVVERVPLDQRRTLFVVKAADEYLLVGGGEEGLQLLSKLDTASVERLRAERPPAPVVSLTPFLQKLLSRRTGSTPPSA